MDQKQQSMERLFEGLYNCVAPMPDGGQAQQSFFTQFQAGMGIKELQDSEAALMADRIPAVQRDYAPGKKVSDVYEEILGAEVPEDTPSPEKKQAYEDAKALTDPENPGYQAYKKAKRVYDRACLAYWRKCNDSKADPVDIAEAKMDMNDAYEDWEAAGRNEISQALETISAYERYTPRAIFNSAASMFAQVQAEEKTKGYYPVTFVPGNWRESGALTWEEIDLQLSSQTFTLSSDAKDTCFSKTKEYSGGWWFWKYKDKTTEEERSMIKSANSMMRTEDLGISLELAVVEIDRPWFHENLLSFSQAWIKNEAAGAICSGTLMGSGAMQLIPAAFVLVRNVKLYNQFSSEEQKLMKQVIDGNSSAVSYGPFSVSRNGNTTWHEEISEDEQEKFGNVSCLNLGPEPQIIGIRCAIASPMFPAVSK